MANNVDVDQNALLGLIWVFTVRPDLALVTYDQYGNPKCSVMNRGATERKFISKNSYIWFIVIFKWSNIFVRNFHWGGGNISSQNVFCFTCVNSFFAEIQEF